MGSGRKLFAFYRFRGSEQLAPRDRRWDCMSEEKTDKRAAQVKRETLTAEARARFEKAKLLRNDRLHAEVEAIRESERLAEGDFAIRINARD